MRKTALLLMITVLVGIWGVPCQAEGNTKIAFIHTQKVILETKAGKDGYAELEQLVELHKQKMQAKEAEIKAAEEELAKQGKMLSESARTEKRENLQKLYKSYSRLKEDAKAEVSAREKALLDKIIDQLAKVIEKVGKDNGYTMILDAEGPSVLFSDTAFNISELVVKEFDKSYQ